MQTHLFSRRPIVLSMQDIDSLTKDSPIALLNALYQCQDFVFVDSTHNPSLNESNLTKTFGYKSSFYLSFIANKDSLSNEYIEARKALYKTYQLIKQEQAEDSQKQQQELKQELQGLDSKQRKSKLQELQREQRKRERQERFSNRNTANKDSYLILESKDKNIAIIFLDSANSLSNLIHLHNNKIDIFTKNGSEIDIESLINDYHLDSNILHSPNTQIFLYSHLLTGFKEIESNPLFFGELDKNGELIESKPIYYLQGGEDIDSVIARNEMTKQSIKKGSKAPNNSNTDSSASLQNDKNQSNNNSAHISTSTLQVFLNNSTLTILNYSLLDSSLNIKLECTSSESKEIIQQEIDCHEAKASRNDNKESISTALLHPILEDNELKCPHNGVVKLKSNKGKPFKSKGIPMILESDLINSSIIGCTNNIAGVPTPCMQVAVILPNARAFKKYNDDYPIMQDLCSAGVMSDKGFPLIATPKPNTFKINSPKPTESKTQSKEKLDSQIKLYKPTLRLHYKITPLQRDNLPIYRLKLNGEISNYIVESYLLESKEVV